MEILNLIAVTLVLWANLGSAQPSSLYAGDWHSKDLGKLKCVDGGKGQIVCSSGKDVQQFSYDGDSIWSVDNKGIRGDIRGDYDMTGIFDGVNTIKWDLKGQWISDADLWVKECTVHTVRVSAEYYEQALTSDYNYKELHHTQNDFFHTYAEANRESGGEAKLGWEALFAISAAGKSVHNDVVDVLNRSRIEIDETTETETYYNPDFTQIVETVRKEVQIGRTISHKETTKVVGLAPAQRTETRGELNLMAKRYISNNYGHEVKGKIRGPSVGSQCNNSTQVCTYEEMICVAPLQEPIPEQTCTPVSFRVRAEYQQQAMTKAYSKRELTKKTHRMTHALTTLINDNEGCGSLSLKGFSFSPSAYNNMRDANNICINETRSFTELTISSEEYNPNFLQIFEIITTEITINDMIHKQTLSNYIDSVPKASPKTSDELDEMARQYILNNWGSETHGEIVGASRNIYEEKGCPVIKIPEIEGFCEFDSDCGNTTACINNFCSSPCSPTTCLLPHEVCLVSEHKPSCHCGKNWERSSTGQCVRPEPGLCLMFDKCNAGDCCDWGSSCFTCPYSYENNNNECAWKGNFQCRWEDDKSVKASDDCSIPIKPTDWGKAGDHICE